MIRGDLRRFEARFGRCKAVSQGLDRREAFEDWLVSQGLEPGGPVSQPFGREMHVNMPHFWPFSSRSSWISYGFHLISSISQALGPRRAPRYPARDFHSSCTSFLSGSGAHYASDVLREENGRVVALKLGFSIAGGPCKGPFCRASMPSWA